MFGTIKRMVSDIKEIKASITQISLIQTNALHTIDIVKAQIESILKGDEIVIEYKIDNEIKKMKKMLSDLSSEGLIIVLGKLKESLSQELFAKILFVACKFIKEIDGKKFEIISTSFKDDIIESINFIYELKNIDSDTICKLNEFLLKELGENKNIGNDVFKFTVDFISIFQNSEEKGGIITRIEDQVGNKGQDFTAKLRDQTWNFENIITFKDNVIQEICREIDTEVLANALFKAPGELKEKIYSNMLKRGAALLKDEIQMKEDGGIVCPQDIKNAKIFTSLDSKIR